VLSLFQQAAAYTQDLIHENEALRERLGEVEKENHQFADRYVRMEQHNSLLQNLFVSSYGLHVTLDPNKVVDTVREIIINLVGGERFGIWMVDEEGAKGVSLLTSEGLDEKELL